MMARLWFFFMDWWTFMCGIFNTCTVLQKRQQTNSTKSAPFTVTKWWLLEPFNLTTLISILMITTLIIMACHYQDKIINKMLISTSKKRWIIISGVRIMIINKNKESSAAEVNKIKHQLIIKHKMLIKSKTIKIQIKSISSINKK